MITESHPLILVNVEVYVPAALTAVPSGRLYDVPWQICALTIDVRIEFTEMFVVITESQPLTLVKVVV